MTVELQQKQRTFLRERFLRLLAGINDQRAEFSLVNGNTVFARFCVSDIDILQFQVIIFGRHDLLVLPSRLLCFQFVAKFWLLVINATGNSLSRELFRVATRPGFRGMSRICAMLSRVPARPAPGRQMSRISRCSQNSK